MTDKTSVEAEEENLLDHEYDGIREYDHPLPRWWVLIFWGSFIFAIGYFLHWSVFKRGLSAHQEYAADMAAAREAQAKAAMGDKVSEEGLAKLMTNSAMMADAQGVYKARCEVCHGAKGEGKIGPNLTDDSWIHGGGTLMDIHKVVGEGVAAKGMPAWNRQLTPIELSKVVAFIGSLRNTNVPGKAPEGTKSGSAAPAGSAAPSSGSPAPSAGASAPSASAAGSVVPPAGSAAPAAPSASGK